MDGGAAHRAGDAANPDSSACRVCLTPLPAGDPRFCPRCGSSCLQEEADPDVGTVICERYRLVRLIGEGASGRVYEATQTVGRSERRVAVKVLLLAHLYNQKVIRRLTREIEIASSLMHPSTIRVFDFGELRDGRPFVVMEFVDGVSLAKLLEGGPIDLQRTCGLMSQICGSLAEAHERGIVHRDLKPENLMIMCVGGQPDLVKVLDFGVAKQGPIGRGSQTPITEEGALVGTPHYMSPEQFSGAELTSASDIYALGLIAYEMLVGRAPFSATDLIGWATCHMTQPPPPFEATEAGARVPPGAREAVFRALAKKPEQRPQTAFDFYLELSAGLEDAPPLGRGSAYPARDSRPARASASWERDSNLARSSATVPFEEPPLPSLSGRPTPTAPMRRVAESAFKYWLLGILLVAAVSVGVWAAIVRPWERPRVPPPLPPSPLTTPGAPAPPRGG